MASTLSAVPRGSNQASTPAAPSTAKKRKLSTQSASKPHIGFIGAGNIARSILEGLILSGEVPKSTMFASCTSESSENYKKAQALGINVFSNNRQIILNSDIIVVAVKPAQVADVMEEIQTVFKEFPTPAAMANRAVSPPRNFRPVVVSVATGVQIADLEQKTEISWMISGYPVAGHLPVIRCIPTVACSIRAGVLVFSRGKYCNDSDVKPFLSLFALTGYCEEVPEKYIDAFTAFSGSGVAFMAVVLEAMTDGGVLVGIPKSMAQRVAAQTMMSTARLVAERGQSPSEVRGAVASPGGTTIHGIQVMEDKGVRAALMGAVQKAAERAAELRPHPPPQRPPTNSISIDKPKTKDSPSNESSKSPQETTK